LGSDDGTVVGEVVTAAEPGELLPLIGDCGMAGKCGIPSFPGIAVVFKVSCIFGVDGVGRAVMIAGLLIVCALKAMLSREM
jgi:hypothetical protein